LSLLRAGYEEARARLDDLEQQSVQMVAPPPSLSGLNLNKRGQALRLHRAGADPANIARSLQLPEAEVELLLKVHSLGEAPPASSEYAAESPGKTLYGKLQGLPMTSGSEHGAEYARFVDLGGRPASGLE